MVSSRVLPDFVLRVLFVLLLICPSSVPQSSQAVPASRAASKGYSPEYTLRQNVNRVVVDVVVTDSNHRPVRGLTKQDFALFEDGREQKILSFDVHSSEDPAAYFKKLPPLPPNTFVNIATEPEKGPLYVLLLDLNNTAPLDQPYARMQLLKFIDAKPGGTRFAVFVHTDNLYLIQGFTANREQLHALLNPWHPISHVPMIFLFGANYPHMMSSVFRQIALYLDGLPGRKNIIWYSEGFPLDLFPRQGDVFETRADVTEMLDALTRGECSIYPVDVSGVVVFPPGRLTGATPGAAPSNGGPGNSSATVNVVPGGSQSMLNPMGAWATAGPPRVGAGGGPLIQQMSAAGVGRSPWDNEFVMDEIADFTGGRAFYSRNDLAKVLEEATDHGFNYYTLTYSPSNLNFDGELRNIFVRLTQPRKGLHLEYRRGYLATAPESPIMPVRAKPRKEDKINEDLNLRPVGDSLSAYMQHGAPIARQVYFQAHVHAITQPRLATPEGMANLVDQPTYFRFRQKRHPKKHLEPIKLQTYQIDYLILARIPNLEVAAGAYDGDSRLLNGDVEEASSPNSETEKKGADYSFFRVQQKIEVPVDAVFLRLGVRDLSTDRMGTLEISLPLAAEPGEAGAIPAAAKE